MKLTSLDLRLPWYLLWLGGLGAVFLCRVKTSAVKFKRGISSGAASSVRQVEVLVEAAAFVFRGGGAAWAGGAGRAVPAAGRCERGGG